MLLKYGQKKTKDYKFLLKRNRLLKDLPIKTNDFSFVEKKHREEEKSLENTNNKIDDTFFFN